MSNDAADIDPGRMPEELTTDYYEVLQISPNADPDTVHRVYRFLAARFHPDNQKSGNVVASGSISIRCCMSHGTDRANPQGNGSRLRMHCVGALLRMCLVRGRFRPSASCEDGNAAQCRRRRTSRSREIE